MMSTTQQVSVYFGGCIADLHVPLKSPCEAEILAGIVQRRNSVDSYAFKIHRLCEKSPYGIIAKPEFLRELKLKEQPMAKLLLPLQLEDIAERNGQCGKPKWIVIGRDVFDLTGKSLTIF